MKVMYHVPKASTTLYATYHPYYKEKSEMTKSAYKLSLLRPPPQLVSSLTTSSNYIIKVMKPLYNVQEASVTRSAIYHPHYKDKFSNSTRSFFFAADNLHSVCSLSNLSTAPAYAAEPSLVIKKGKSPRTSLYILFHQPLSLFLSSMLSEICSAIFEYLAMPQYASLMFRWQFSSIFAVENRKYFTSTKNLPDASFNLSCVAQTAQFLPDNHTVQLINYVICVPNSTNNINIIYRCNRTTCNVLSVEFYIMTYEFEIEKRY